MNPNESGREGLNWISFYQKGQNKMETLEPQEVCDDCNGNLDTDVQVE